MEADNNILNNKKFANDLFIFNYHNLDLILLKYGDISKLPPDIIAQTFLSINLLSLSIAAKTKAPDI